MLPARFSTGGLHVSGGLLASGRLDDVGAGVRPGFRSADLADEDVNPAKGDPKTILNGVSLGPQPASSM